VPFQNSLRAEAGGSPPIDNATVCVPDAAGFSLAVFKSLTSVQDVPFHISVFATTVVEYPPKAIAAVCVPQPPSPLLAVFKSFTSVQLVPFQVSVFPTFAGAVAPPKIIPAV
jgi:hypothetical protein